MQNTTLGNGLLTPDSYRENKAQPVSRNQEKMNVWGINNLNGKAFTEAQASKQPKTVNAKNHTSANIKAAHPFYQNTLKYRRNSGVDPFRNMQRFDESCIGFENYVSDKKSLDRCIDFHNEVRTRSVEKLRSKSNKSLSRSTRKSKSPSRWHMTQQTVIQPYKRKNSTAASINLKEYEKEKGKVKVSELTKTGIWK